MIDNIMIKYKGIIKKITIPKGYDDLLNSFYKAFDANETKKYCFSFTDEDGDDLQIDSDVKECDFIEIPDKTIIVDVPDEDKEKENSSDSNVFNSNNLSEGLNTVQNLSDNLDNSEHKSIKVSNIDNSDIDSEDPSKLQNILNELKMKNKEILSKNKELSNENSKLKGILKEKEDILEQNEDEINNSKVNFEKVFESKKIEIENEYNKREEEINKELIKTLQELKKKYEENKNEVDKLNLKFNEEQNKKK